MTRYLSESGRLVAVIDPTGTVHARLAWRDGVLVELAVPGAIVRGALVDDPLLGRAHEIVVGPIDLGPAEMGTGPFHGTSTEMGTGPFREASAEKGTGPFHRTSTEKGTGPFREAPAEMGTGPFHGASTEMGTGPFHGASTEMGTGPLSTLVPDSRSRVLTTMSAIDWARPTEIPAIAAPGALPFGAGGAILNVLAILAQRAGIVGLRYAGPYPTSALWSTLARSFRTAGSEDAFVAAFEDRAARIARDPMDPIFIPAPHERIAIHRRNTSVGSVGEHHNIATTPHIASGCEHHIATTIGIVELRDGIERVTLEGIAFARGASIARLVDDNALDSRALDDHALDDRALDDHALDDHALDDHALDDHALDDRALDDRALDDRALDDRALDDRAVDDRALDSRALDDHATDDQHDCVCAEVWFADERYARVAAFAADGRLIDGPHSIPPCTDAVVGAAFPPPLATALAELVADAVAAPLADIARTIVDGSTLRWADLGARAAARVGDELHVHAALWRIAPQGMARLALAIVEAIVPIVTMLATRRVLDVMSR